MNLFENLMKAKEIYQNKMNAQLCCQKSCRQSAMYTSAMQSAYSEHYL